MNNYGIDPADIDPDTNRPYAGYSSPALDTSFHDSEMDVDEDYPEPEPSQYVIAVYELDRAYGGPEEGGWYYTTGQLVRVFRILKDKRKAYQYMGRLNHWLRIRNKGLKYGSGSVLYAGGEYGASIFPETAPRFFPEERPHYE